MRSPFTILADIIDTTPWAVAAAVILLVLVSLYGATNLSMETGIETYVDIETPQGAVLNEYLDIFSTSAVIIIVEGNDITDIDVIEYIYTLQQDLNNEIYIAGTSSVADLMVQMNGGRVPSGKAEISAVLSRIPAEAVSQYLSSQQLTLIFVPLDAGLSSDSQRVAIENIERVIASYPPPTGVSLTVSGSPAYEQQMLSEMSQSMGVLIMTALALMVIAVGLLFSHVRYSLLPVAVVFIGMLNTFGIMGLFGISISMVVIGAFPVLIGVGIDYAIQFHSRLDDESQRRALSESVRITVEKTGPSVLYAMTATALGFIAMFTSTIPMVQNFGKVCAIGVLFCYISALLIVPTYAKLVRYTPKAKKNNHARNQAYMQHYNNQLGSIARKIAGNPVPVILIFGMIAGIGYQIDSEIPINTDEDTFVPKDMPAVIDMKKITRVIGATETLPVYIRSDDIYHTDTLRWIRDFQEYELQENQKIIGASSIATLIERYNDGHLPSSDADIAAVVEEIPPSELSRLTSGNMITIIEFSLVEMSPDQALAMVNTVKSDLAFHHPPAGVTAELTGSTDMFAQLITDIQNTKVTMTMLGFGLITGFLLLLYRKFSAISPIIPIVMIVGWNSLIMYALKIDYTPMTAVLGSMTIGIACEYTILIMERYHEERKAGNDVDASIERAVRKIGTAITVSGLTTVFGFSALMMSAFEIISNFGTTTVITVGFSLIGAILVMPAVLKLISRFECDAPVQAT
ncbi:hydrophobe/amphiphile efflux-3 (HAE3) family transporter [Methanogenium sp. S4BF]|nr:hydrophobe/amphiphile efflux-3 (HAE3) family transporter [Methanogenium sp. S4BF]WFN35666.1 hydrophobe/amphiphile efflux-3 (HAE3) family transporter [Methanogenium sp. S4BF]